LTLPDARLLKQFVAMGDEAAFAAIVRRYGPLVLGACQRVLNDRHAAEDAFQSTFMVLARKARFLKQPESLGPWLYGVATRTALKARAKAARQHRVEQQAALDSAAAQPFDLGWGELRPILDEAVAALPQSYRVPFVLHHLEGATVAEVARILGCPSGTVAARLARAKVRLRTRLTRRGVTLSAAAFVAALSANMATASVPTVLAAGVVQVATRVATGSADVAVSATSAVFAKGVIHTMSLTKLKVAALLLATGALGVGASLSCHETMIDRGNGTNSIVSPACPANTQAGDLISHQVAGSTNAERHYAGGFRSTRGFEFRSPASEPGPCEKGSDFQFLNSVEYQVPICAKDTIYRVAFVDSGTVEKPVDHQDYRVGAGFGVRIVVPQLGPVPISLDFAFPIVGCKPGAGRL
jgi:RNA polymerase sigma factor (sigma-70 family)